MDHSLLAIRSDDGVANGMVWPLRWASIAARRALALAIQHNLKRSGVLGISDTVTTEG